MIEFEYPLMDTMQARKHMQVDHLVYFSLYKIIHLLESLDNNWKVVVRQLDLDNQLHTQTIRLFYLQQINVFLHQLQHPVSFINSALFQFKFIFNNPFFDSPYSFSLIHFHLTANKNDHIPNSDIYHQHNYHDDEEDEDEDEEEDDHCLYSNYDLSIIKD